ncbi:MAG: hypothetical protein WBH75_11160 [Thermoanaerobaculia bacterium]
MGSKSQRHVVAVLLLAAICLVAGTGTLEAGASRAGGGTQAADGDAIGAFVAGLLWATTGIWDMAGAGLDPNGITGKAGAGLDPNGYTDSAGAGLDPNGITAKAGAGLDPNGNTDKAGAGLDPNGIKGKAGAGLDPNG